METPNIKVKEHRAKSGAMLYSIETQRGNRQILIDERDLEVINQFANSMKEQTHGSSIE